MQSALGHIILFHFGLAQGNMIVVTMLYLKAYFKYTILLIKESWPALTR